MQGNTVVYVQDNTSAGTFTNLELERMVWCLDYWGRFQYNRSPWVEHDYDVFAVTNLKVLPKGEALPSGGWILELLDTSDQPGALGYHEDKARVSKEGTSGVHSIRGIHHHLLSQKEVPLMKVFVKTCNEDGVATSEVCCHEVGEALVDPWVTKENEMLKFLDPATQQWWAGEIGDPVQGRAYDVGAPEGRPCGVPEAMMADIAYPMLFGQAQTRQACSFTEDVKAWEGTTAPNQGLKPFQIAPEGYMSVAPQDEPENWTQIRGEKAPVEPNKQ